MMRLLALFVGLAMLATPARAADRNVVFFVADDHGTEALGAYGNRVVKTPSLDQLALDGVRFTHAFATTASCSASRSVLLTGVHNHRNGQYGHEHEYHHFSAFPNVRSLPVLLAEAGYRTARGGKFHVAPESVFRFQQVITLPTLEAFIKADSAKPFFVYYGTHEPHRPFNHDAEDRVDPRSVTVPPWLPDIPEVRDELALYEASVRKVDKAFGTLVDTLKRTGTYEDTLIVYLSDNGAPFPGSKTNVYEPGIRLPLIVKKPGQARRGIVNTAMISWVDITPTILDFAGVRIAPPPPSQPVEPGRFTNETPAIQGRSFLGIVEQQQPVGWDEVYASHTFHEITMYYPMRVVRTRTHKLIWNIAHPLPYPFASDLFASKSWQGALARKLATFGPRTIQAYTQRPAFELYDLERDPLESANLAADPKHAHVLADLKARINQIAPDRLRPGVTQQDRPFPQFSNVSIVLPAIGRSDYHAGTARLEKRFSDGFSFLTTYTYSKFLNDTDEGGADVGDVGVYSDFYNRAADYGPSGNDIRHRLTVSGVYELPIGPDKRFLSAHWLGHVVGGWSIGLLGTLQSGAPFTVLTQTNTTNAFSAGGLRADVAGNPALPSSERTLGRWFNTDAFTQPAPFTFGNSRRGILRGDGVINADLSLAKNVSLGRARSLQLRVELFNAFNHTNFGLPGHTLGAPNFGIVSNAAGGRTIQLGLRAVF